MLQRTRRPVSRFRSEARRPSTPGPQPTSATARSVSRTRPTRRSSAQLQVATPPSTIARQPSATTESRGRAVANNRFRSNSRRQQYLLASSTSTSSITTTVSPLTTPKRRRLVSKDQHLESTNLEDSMELRDASDTASPLADLAVALIHVQKADPPTRKPMPEYRVETANEIGPTNKPISILDLDEELISKVKISTPQPFSLSLPPAILASARPSTRTNAGSKYLQIHDKNMPLPIQTYTYRPITDYDYYGDGETKYSIPEHSKVLIHSSGVIQCLDQGNFPHPVSCKKFISCAKMETGNVLGWEYTCPKNLSFDPIGGICNWSAGLGCNE